MTNQEDFNEKEKEGQVIPFRTAIGGNNAPPNWLLDMETGTIFLAREINDKLSYTVPLFQHGGAQGEFVLLIENIHGNMDMKWADAVRFCRRYELARIIATPDELERKKNGKSILPGPDDGVDNQRTPEEPQA